jgi:hypothetical protein
MSSPGLSFPSIPARSLCPKKSRKSREWKNRNKVSSNLSKDFPWEIILSHLQGHARSLILLQMVDKNLYHLISTDHVFWLKQFKRHLSNKAFCVQQVSDPLYPSLRLWKSHLHGIPVHSGILRGDHDDALLPFGFDQCFTSYVRRAFALANGTRCGMCGCRYRHEPYWSLRMRVCRLCVEANTLSSDELCCKYGVDFSDLVVQLKGRIFFFPLSNSGRDDRLQMHYLSKTQKTFTYLFWKPHLEQFLDLSSLCQKQKQRKQAVQLLCTAIKRRWILHQRSIYAVKMQHYSIDCLVLSIRRNERSRVVNRYGMQVVKGGPSWAFSDRTQCGFSKFTARNNKPIAAFCQTINDGVDSVV